MTTRPLRLCLIAIILLTSPALASPLRMDCQAPDRAGWDTVEEIPLKPVADAPSPVTLVRYIWSRYEQPVITFNLTYLYRPTGRDELEYVLQSRGRVELWESQILIRIETMLCNARAERESSTVRGGINLPRSLTSPIVSSRPLLDASGPMPKALVAWLRSLDLGPTDEAVIPQFRINVLYGAQGERGSIYFVVLTDLPVSGVSRHIPLRR